MFLLSTACPTSVLDDTIFGGKLVGILKTLVSPFASSIEEFCDDATASPVAFSALFSVYDIHTNKT